MNGNSSSDVVPQLVPVPVITNPSEPTLMSPPSSGLPATPADSAPPQDPLRVLFMLTSMPVGGAETLLANLMRSMNPLRFQPELCCLKQLGPLGEEIAQAFPTSSQLLHHKYDVAVLPRLVRRLRGRVDALITVGAGDKMFWGRVAAHLARTPVVLSALHSTGWPDGIGRLNRLLTPWTDGFIAVAREHGRFLVEHERLPAEKVHVIPNGVDTKRFVFDAAAPFLLRKELGLSADVPLCGIVAALRPEKNHRMFLRVAKRVRDQLPRVRFVVVGDGAEATGLQQYAADLGIADHVFFLGNRNDIPRVLAALNVFCLTSLNEANPVSILESLSVQVPVVATDVGSVASTVQPNQTGFLAPSEDDAQFADRVLQILNDPALARRLGAEGRDRVEKHWSLERMVRGYEQLILDLFYRNRSKPNRPQSVRTGEGVVCGAHT